LLPQEKSSYKVRVGSKLHLTAKTDDFKIGTFVYPYHMERRYLHFEVMVGLAWSNDPASYTGGSIATGRVSQVGQVKGDDPDKGTLVLQVGG
jgi:hypothetical protein